MSKEEFWISDTPFYEKLAQKFNLDLTQIKQINSVGEVTKGYCIIRCKEKEHLLYKDKVLISEGEMFYIYDFLLLQLFIDKYSPGEEELPVNEKIKMRGQTKEEAIKWSREAMKIILQPMHSYEDLLNNIDIAEKRLKIDIRNIESFNGIESLDKTLNGTNLTHHDFNYRVYKPVTKDIWDIYYYLERSYNLEFKMRIYGHKYLYEYILNLHLRVVL